MFYLIDDDVEEHQIFEIALADADKTAKLIAASSAVAALEELNSGKVSPDFIFLDLEMPLMNGWKFLEEVRNIDTLSKIPIIIYSAFEQKITREELEKFEITSFIFKQPRISNLSLFIQQILAKKEV